ncbi:hypothetical protein AWC38_SpisGene9087 [Stylophora pistillata]|uniref:Uncharacterized protein n=1 Tax=Stylophora pistillata TaxID=50429 RepID=A0A2B4SCF2_STYPI|nr:hypothetical protein AWC38_SpisGene9087 [Stylophora pistillata]
MESTSYIDFLPIYYPNIAKDQLSEQSSIVQWKTCVKTQLEGIPHSLGEDGMLFYDQSSSWRPSEWVAVENFKILMYMNISLTSGTALETFDKPGHIYPNYPVRVGALQINDTVLAPFSSDYSLGKVTVVQDWLTYDIQPDACKLQLQTACPPNSESTREFMNDKFPTF